VLLGRQLPSKRGPNCTFEEDIAMRLIAIALVAPLAVVLVGLPIAVSWKPASEPRTLADVIASADRKGLYWTSVPIDDPYARRLIVSAMPLDEDAAGLVNLSFATDGVASCYIAWDSVRIHYDPHQSAFWGDIFVHGDPAIVKILTGANPGDR